jgi:hypothetical protein
VPLASTNGAGVRVGARGEGDDVPEALMVSFGMVMFEVRIPLDLGARSGGTWAVVPEHLGARSERSDEWGRSGGGGLELSRAEALLFSPRGTASPTDRGVFPQEVPHPIH